MIVDGLQKMCSDDVRGKFSFSGGFGKLQFSYNRFGHYSEFAGIYCKYKKNDKIYTLKKKFYRPTNPNSINQRKYRNMFNDVWNYWYMSSDIQKDYWRKMGKKYGITGQNYLMKLWFNSFKK